MELKWFLTVWQHLHMKVASSCMESFELLIRLEWKWFLAVWHLHMKVASSCMESFECLIRLEWKWFLPVWHLHMKVASSCMESFESLIRVEVMVRRDFPLSPSWNFSGC
jgi:hypothetical protein